MLKILALQTTHVESITEEKTPPIVDQVIDLALTNIDNQGGPFGAAIVYNGICVATGANRVTANCDPSAHAEVMALRAAIAEHPKLDLSKTELYTSCEPCPMCLAACMESGIQKVYYMANRHDAADAGFDDAFLYEELTKPWQERSLTITSSSDKSDTSTYLSTGDAPLYAPESSLTTPLNGFYVQAVQRWCQTLNNFSLEDRCMSSQELPTLFELAMLYWARVSQLTLSNEDVNTHFGTLILAKDMNTSEQIKLIAVPTKRALLPFDKWRANTEKTDY